VAAPAYAGIPVTHRDHTTSVCFITGHEDPTKEQSGHNWEVYAKSNSTLVFYMGVKNLPMIAGRLMENGRDPETPVALVRWGTRPEQESFVSTLAEVAEEAARRKFAAPSIIVVGGVCGLHDKLGWFEKKPLLGKGVAVTRAREQASGLVRELGGLGARVYEFPTITIEPLDDYAEVDAQIGSLSGWDWCVFTSVNGVKRFFERMRAMGKDARAFAGVEMAAIGPATADALRERGIEPDFVPEKYVAEHVVEGLLARGVKGKRVLIPRAKVAREVLPEELAKAGAEVRVLPVYETRLSQQGPEVIEKALGAGELHYVTFTSSSTVDNFFELVGPREARLHRPGDGQDPGRVRPRAGCAARGLHHPRAGAGAGQGRFKLAPVGNINPQPPWPMVRCHAAAGVFYSPRPSRLPSPDGRAGTGLCKERASAPRARVRSAQSVAMGMNRVLIRMATSRLRKCESMSSAVCSTPARMRSSRSRRAEGERA
jgi:uroporphyrinogen III methyltransferase/synthase